MSHTYKDESGVIFHYNSDLSGDVGITCPGKETLDVQADVLSRFIFHAMIDPEETLTWLDKLREWVNRHTNAVTQYQEERALETVTPCLEPERRQE